MYETIIEQLHYFRYKPADDNKIHAAKRVMPTGIDNYIKYRTLLFYTISGFTVLSCKGMTNTFYIVVIENILLDQVLQSEHHTLIQCSDFDNIRIFFLSTHANLVHFLQTFLSLCNVQ